MVGGKGFLEADSAAATGPGGFAEIAVVGADEEGSSANADDVGGEGRITDGGRALVAGGAEEGDALVAGGCGEGGVGASFFDTAVDVVELEAVEAHGDDGDAGPVGGGGDGGVKIGVGGAVGLEKDDVGVGGDGVGPFDVERFFDVPAAGGGIGGERCAAGLVEDLEGWTAGVEGGEAEVGAESVGVGDDVGVVVGVDDGDGFAAAVSADAVEEDVVDAVGVADFGGRVGAGRGGDAR